MAHADILETETTRGQLTGLGYLVKKLPNTLAQNVPHTCRQDGLPSNTCYFCGATINPVSKLISFKRRKENRKWGSEIGRELREMNNQEDS